MILTHVGITFFQLTHSPRGCRSNLQVYFSTRFTGWYHENFLSNWSEENSTEHLWQKFIISQAICLRAVRPQAITWANVYAHLCRHMASLGHNALIDNYLLTKAFIWHISAMLCLSNLHFNVWYWPLFSTTLRWRHNERDGVSNHRRFDCLLNRLFRRRSKKTSKLRVTGLCEGNSPMTGEFPVLWASNAKNVSIWWHHHEQSRSYSCD